MRKTVNRAIKVRIYPTAEQEHVIRCCIGCCRFVHNQMIAHARNTGNVPSFSEMCAMLPGMKKEHDWLSDVDATALQRAARDVSQAYRNHFKRPDRFGWPVFKSKRKSRLSYTSPCNGGRAAWLMEDGVRLPKVGFVKAKVSRRLPDTWKQLSVTVSITRTGKFFASVTCELETEIPETPIDRETAVGLDYKSDGLYVSSDGEMPGSLKSYRKTERRLAHQQRMLSKKQGSHKGEEQSAAFRKQKRKVAALYEKSAHQREDRLHKLSSEIANRYDTVCVEDLDLRSMANKGFGNGKATMDNGYGSFVFMLEYKLAERGGRLVKASRWFPSSQKCSKCGAIHPEMKDLHRRTMECGCGNVMDRDLNAAVNILNEGLRMLGA